MPSTLDTLIGRIADERLRADMRAAVDDLRKITDFGLVFEAHIPETVRLPHHSIRRGIKVTLRELTDQSMFDVVAVNKKFATIRRLRHPDGSALSSQEASETANEKVALTALVALAEFGDPIYPGMHHLGSLNRGGDKPAHVVIKGENHHALEALKFTHAGKVDAIYIDPPYNSGARDWKYNNDYVDADDGYRHSKWLAFMERRLKLAKELMNPADSVLIVTIDEKEYLRLGLLLEQTFPEAAIQMVSTLVNPAAVARPGAFGRSDEYVFFVQIGAAVPKRTRLGPDWVSARGRTHTGRIRWDLLRRSGTNAARSDRPRLFYPIYIDPSVPKIASTGEHLAEGLHEAPSRDGLVALLPIRQDGSEGNWTAMPSTLMTRVEQGRVRVTGSVDRGFTISMLKNGEYAKIQQGEYTVEGRAPDGSLIVADRDVSEGALAIPQTQWRIASHDSTQYGSRLLSKFLPDRRFPFPKSLYAVEDALRFFVGDKPDAVVLDFFGGSGTTTHAVMRLNREDGGRRRSILVTNNEVSETEAETLREHRLRPGDPEWEVLGIFEHITRPRMTAAVTGLTPEGAPIAGNYNFVDEFPMAEGFEENVDFFELIYLDPAQIEVDRAFAAIAPLLWLRAAGRGRIIDESTDAAGRRKPYALTEQYGVLFNTDRWRSFISKLPDNATTVYIVTDSITEFSHIAGDLPSHLDVVRLYERYLTTFTMNGR
jgi:adenine-specific DNA-methyltransferase